MSQRIEKDFIFDNAIHFNKSFFLNRYEMTLSMLVETSDIHDQNTALNRINHLMEMSISMGIWISEKDTAAIKKYKNAGINICTTPDQPYDQTLSTVLLQKCNAITEGRVVVTDLILGSIFSEGIRFHTVMEVAEETLDASSNKWWNCNSPCTEHREASDGNIVKLFNDEWETLDLSFNKKVKKTKSS
tara:strand:- start:1417 stop:1980 length:564 start_codon:yes stop_codon:yes gene_type:complete